MPSMIDVEDLVKVYPDGTRAVDGVTFDVRPGEIFGFLGPNGAGKTTAIRVLVTLLPKTSGRASVGGHDVDREPEAVRRMIGYAGQFIGVDPDLTAHENLVMQSRLHGMTSAAAAARARELLEIFALADVATKRAGAFSGGMRRRLDLAQALTHSPPLVFLDEPTTGLDPQTRNALWRHLGELRSGGTTVFLTTQHMEEADRLCDRLAIIDRGKIVVGGSPDSLKEQLGGEVVHVTLADAAHAQRAMDVLAALPGAGAPAAVDGMITLPIPDAGRALSDLVRRLDDAGIGVAELSFARPSLDEVFLRFTGERMRVEETAGMGHSSMTMGRRPMRG